MGKEIVTLQFGPYANYTGTHFWNLESELFDARNDDQWKSLISYLDLSALQYTGGGNSSRDIFCPRVVSFNTKSLPESWSSRNRLESTNSILKTLRHKQSIVASWRGCMKITKYPDRNHNFHRDINKDNGRIVPRSEWTSPCFTNPSHRLLNTLRHELVVNNSHHKTDADVVLAADELDHTARHSTDFANFKLHERSQAYLPSNLVGSDGFLSFGEGLDIAKQTDFLDDWENRIRFFVEDCDSIQGFLSLVDVSSGFTGTAAHFMEYLYDTYPHVPILSLGVRRPLHSEDFSRRDPDSVNSYDTSKLHQDRISALNEALLTAYASQYVTLLVPMECPRHKHLESMRWDPDNNYHTSAVLACILNTLILPTRVVSGHPGDSSFGAPLGCEADIDNLCQTAIGDGGTGLLASVNAAVEAPIFTDYDRREHRSELGFSRDSNVSFNCDTDERCDEIISEWVVSRGARVTLTHNIANTLMRLCKTEAYKTSLSAALMSAYPSFPKRLSVIPTPIKLPLTFPSRTLTATRQTKTEVSMLARLGCSISSIATISRHRRTIENITRSSKGKSIMKTWNTGSEVGILAAEYLVELEEKITKS